MRLRRARGGFTLVELLVVISIIAMLMALLFPAVQAARETARGNTCRNNIRNLAIAVIQYEKQKNGYPGYALELHPNNVGAARAPRSWIFGCLPYMERSDLYETYNTGMQQPVNIDLEIIHCPTNPAQGLDTHPACSYVCNTGLPDAQVTASTPADWNANGIFHDTRAYVYDASGPTTAVPVVTRVAEGYVSTGDGTGTTILLAENADARSWYLVGTGEWDSTNNMYPYERYMGATWNASVSTATSNAPPADPDGLPGPPANSLLSANIGGDTVYTNIQFARPAAYHPNVVNVAFASGNVRPISTDINYRVYAMLMSPRGRQTKLAGATTQTDPMYRLWPLNEKDIQ